MAATTEDVANLLVTVTADLTKVRKQMGEFADVVAKTAKQNESAVKASNDNQAKSYDKTAAAATRSMRAVRGESANMAAQFQDIAVQLQGGGSPFTVALQQGQQLGAVLTSISSGAGIKGVVAGLGAAVGNFLNPVTLITVGLIAATGYAVKFFASMSEGAALSGKELESLGKDVVELGKKFSNAQLQRAGQSLIDTVQTEQDVKKLDDTVAQFRAHVRAAGTDVKAGLAGLISAFGDIPEAGAALNKMQKAFEAFEADVAAGNIDKAAKDLGEFNQGLIEAGKTQLEGSDVLKQIGDATKDLPGEVDAWTNALQGAVKGHDDIKNRIDRILAGTKDYQKALEGLDVPLSKQDADIKKINDDWFAAVNAAQTYGQVLLANSKYNERLTALSLEAAGAISTQSSATSDYAKIVDRLEGTAKNPNSSAVGKFQFIDSTFVDVARKLGLGIGKTDAEVLKLRDDLDVVDAVFQRFTEDNAAGLRNVGIAATDANKYIAHFLGLGDAITVLKAAPDTLISKLLDSDKIRANAKLLGQAGETVADFQAKISQKVAAATAAVAPTDFQSAITAAQQHTEVILAEAKASGQLTEAFNAEAAAKEKAKVETELLQAAGKDGAEVSAEQKAQIDAVATAAGNAAGQIKGYTDATKNNSVWLKFSADAQKDAAVQAQKNADAFAQLGTSFATTFINDLKQGKSATEALTDALAQLADQLLQMVLSGLFKQIGASLFNVPAGMSGGMVGSLGSSKRVGPLAFVGAPRMAKGGLVGVGPGEYPTILHRGEVVIPASMVRAAARMPSGGSGGGGGNTKISVGNISISTNLEGTGDVKGDTERGKQIGRLVQASVQAELTKQSRPGGLLTASGSAGRVGR